MTRGFTFKSMLSDSEIHSGCCCMYPAGTGPCNGIVLFCNQWGIKLHSLLSQYVSQFPFNTLRTAEKIDSNSAHPSSFKKSITRNICLFRSIRWYGNLIGFLRKLEKIALVDLNLLFNKRVPNHDLERSQRTQTS